MNGKTFPWETPLSSSDGLQSTTVQVASDVSIIQNAVKTMKHPPKEKDFKKWLGQLVTVIDISPRGEVKCKLKSSSGKKTETIWLVPGALTHRVKSTEELVHRTLQGIYSSVYRKLENGTQVAVHALCQASGEGDTLFCISNVGGDEVHELTRASSGLYEGKWRLNQEVQGHVTLTFTKNKSDGILQRSADFFMNLLGRNSDEREDIKIAWPHSNSDPGSVWHIFCQLNFGKPASSKDQWRSFVSALHQGLSQGSEAEKAPLLSHAIEVFDVLCCELRSEPNLDLQWWVRPMTPLQGIFACYVLGRILGPPSDSSAASKRGFFRGCLVLVEQRSGGKKDKVVGERVCEVLQDAGQKLRVRMRRDGAAEDVDTKNVKPVFLSKPVEVLKLVQDHILNALVECGPDMLEMLFNEELFCARFGLQALLSQDAVQSGVQWIYVTRHLVEVESEVGDLNLQELLEAVTFSVPQLGDSSLHQALLDVGPVVDHMTDEMREGFFKILLGRRCCMEELMTVLLASEGTPGGTGLKSLADWLGVGTAEKSEDPKALMHKILGSLTFKNYHQQLIDNTKKDGAPSRLARTCELFQKARCLKTELLGTWEQLFMALIVQAAWLSERENSKQVEEVAKSFAAILTESEETVLSLLKKMLKLLLKTCIVKGRKEVEVYFSMLMRHLSAFMQLLDQTEVKQIMEEYISMQCSNGQASLGQKVDSEVRKLLLSLRAAGELLAMLPTWSVEVAPQKFISSVVKGLCKEQNPLVLLESLQYLGCGPPQADLKDMCHLLVEMIGRQARVISDDGAIFLKSVNLILTAVKSVPPRYVRPVDSALAALLSGSEAVEVPSLMERSGEPWRLLLAAWDQLGERSQGHLKKLFQEAQEYLEVLLAGRVVLDVAETLLAASRDGLLDLLESMAKYLVTYANIYGYPKLSDIGPRAWAEVVVNELMRKVSTYNKQADCARAFLNLCQQCGAKDASKVSKAALALLQHDRQQTLQLLSCIEDRWWSLIDLPQIASRVKHLQNCAIFRSLVSEQLQSMNMTVAFDEVLEEDEEVLISESIQSHKVYLCRCHYSLSASRYIAKKLPHFFDLFVSLCKILAHTRVDTLSFVTVRSIVSLDEDVKEQLRSAEEASGVLFPDEILRTIETASRIVSAVADMKAVLDSTAICGFERHLPHETAAAELVIMEMRVSQTATMRKSEVTKCDQLGLKVKNVAQAVANIESYVLSQLNCNNCTLVVRALAEAKDVYEFLESLPESEDLMHLQDSVETYSDELLRADTIFALMDVHSFFKAVYRKRRRMTFVEAVTQSVQELDIKNLDEKLRTCTQHSHGLKNLYKNLANREEAAAEKIRAAVKQGTFKVMCNTEGVHISVSYGQRSLSKSELIDLRARAMLNPPEETSNASRDERRIMTRFYEQVDVLLQASESLETLREEGFYWARKQNYEVSSASANALDGLKELEKGFQDDLEEWRQKLQEARAEYPELSFVHSKQFWLLADFLQGRHLEDCDTQMVLSMLSHMQGKALSQEERSRTVAQVLQYCISQFPDRAQLQKWFQEVGQRLVRVLTLVTRRPRQQLLGDLGSGSVEMEMGLNSVIEVGQVRSVHARSKGEVLRMALSFYGGTGFLPRAHQMLFCSPNTSWPELDAFLSRCRHVPGLYCILHVERLTYKMQHRMVERIHSGQLGLSYRLVLMAMCSNDQVAEVHTLTEIPPKPAHALSPKGMQDFMRRLAPHLVCVVSEDAGCGKTETVLQRAFALRKAVVTVPLSGPLNMGNFIERLLMQMQKWRPCDCLHLDIGLTHEVDLLDDILVQISFFGCVQADSKIAVVPRDYTFVELANLSTPALRSLTISTLVPPTVVRFEMNNFYVSPEPRSPAQVVCKVLEALENQSLQVRRVTLDGEPIGEDRCRDLLRRHVVEKIQGPPSYALLHMVLRVLAVQFIGFSNSVYFDPQQLKDLKLSSTLRTQLVECLLEACLDFTTRAVTAGKMRQRQQHMVYNDADQTAAMLEGMVRWSDTKPLLLFNRFDRQTLSPVYREERDVSREVRDLFLSQTVGKKGRLPNFQTMKTEELEALLGRIILPLGKELGKPAEGSSYVVSPDNFIKMIWIALRVESRVPVIIMGETGCGKTSLIRHLAKLLSVDFKCLNVHAGISAEDIIHFVQGAASNAKETWAFLDEVNTCEHMGLATEILCHRRVLGKPLPDNLVVLAACNPYRLKKKLTAEAELAQSQLSLGDTSKRRKLSSLVYSVQELPEALYDYLYDFGFLGKKEEESYVKAMVEPVFSPSQNRYGRSTWQECLKDLILFSQEFTAENQPDCLLSLRDVKRCVKLVEWFQETTLLRERASKQSYSQTRVGEREYYQNRNKPTQLSEEEKTLRSVLNALAVSYHCRLPTHKLRYAYRSQVAQILQLHERRIPRQDRQRDWTVEDIINWLLTNEMWLYLEHMDLPPMTAENHALLENVFVMMVCILNRIPVFAVGKPGNSKSLALQILKTNLKGMDSKKELWRSFPRIYVVSYQGSEVSTSEGITKVFEKAENYRKSIASGALVLVHFDEIGLAEASPNNPLKVLHAHLEPGYPKDRPDFAVVGLSNFPLDAAKMNRAIALVRPPPHQKDLMTTAQTICARTSLYREQHRLKTLACLYHVYYKEQRVADFHGLRDFYALVKTLAKTWPGGTEVDRSKAIYRALARNFGGLPPRSTGQSQYPRMYAHCDILKMQAERPDVHVCSVDPNLKTSVIEMLEENLADPDARHLMLVCSGEVNVPLSLLQSAALKQNKNLQIMMGSTFSEDQSDRYSAALLKRVVLSMERGDILVMRGLDSIHGSLYDMLNMSYSSFASKRQCRIALGDRDISVPVHENFRCVVLQDEAKLPTADAAFLNRFEKHYVSINDMVQNPAHRVAVKKLEDMAALATKGPRLAESPCPQSLFMAWGVETAASLINYIHQRGGDKNEQALVDEAWRELASMASVDGMLRATELSMWAQGEQTEEWRSHFFAQPSSLRDWLETNGWQNAPANSATAVRFAVVLTTSPIQVDLGKVLRDRVPAFECLAVDALTSELDFSHRLDEFNDASLPPGAVLVLQLRADSPHVELLRHRVTSELRKERRALLLLHGSRQLMMSSRNRLRLRLSFQAGWAQVFLERLIKECSLDARRCVELGLEQFLQDDGPMPFQTVLKTVLSECFWSIKYPATQAAAEHVKEVTKVALNDKGLLELFQEICLQKIRCEGNEVWWHKVIREMQRMPGHASFSEYIEAHIRHLVRGPAAVLVYLLEKSCALYTLRLYPNPGPMRTAWFQICSQRVLPQLEKVLPPTGPEYYQYPQHLQHLRIPFSFIFAEELDSFRSSYMEHKLHQVQHGDARLQDFRQAMEAAIPAEWFRLLKDNQEDYAEDLAALRLTAVPLPQEDQRRFLRPIMKDRVTHGGIPELHQFLWQHEGTLQLALRQLAAIRSSLRDLDRLLSARPVPTAAEQLPSQMARMMCLISAHACGALHPTADTLAAVEVDWLPAAVRVLSAAKSCLELIPREERAAVVELSALSIITELSQKIERINLHFWKQIGLRAPIRRPEQLSSLVQDVLKAAEPHLSQTALQRFQRFAHQRLLEHGVSEGVLKSVISGRPAVATAMLLRELVQSAVQQDPSCFLKSLQTGSCGQSNNALRALDQLAKEAKIGDPLCAVMCIELQDSGFPDVDVASTNSFFPSDAISSAVALLKSLLQTSDFGLVHVAAAAVLRLASARAAEALVKEDGTLWDNGLEDLLAATCRHAGSDAAGFVASLLRGTVLREVHGRLTSDDATGRVVELCQDVPWLAVALPGPGNAPLLKSHAMPIFLGGFLPEAVQAAQVLSVAAQLKSENPEFLQLTQQARTDGPLAFAYFCATSAFLCGSHGGSLQDASREAARVWFKELPRLQVLPPLLRGQTEALPAEMRHQLEVAPMQMLTALHLAAALLAAPSSGFSYPFKAVASGSPTTGFLPAMPDDEEEVILKALLVGYTNAHHRGHTRYMCQCGYKYIVADCGAAVQTGRCPSCSREIGGYDYARRSNQQLDQRPRLGENEGQRGYFHHDPSRDRRHAVRQLTPLPYRAMHFLLHSAMLGPCFQHGVVPRLLHMQSILQHLTADWAVLTELLDGSPAGFLMDLAERLLYPTDSGGPVRSGLSSAQRIEWEKSLAEAVVMPCVDTTRRADFDAKLDWAASLGAMQDALPQLLSDRLPPMGIATCNIAEELDAEPSFTTELPELLTLNGRCLELGCGDLSFACSWLEQRRRSGTAGGFHLTTSMLEYWAVVKTRYDYSQRQPGRASAESHRRELESHGCRVMERVDGTSLTETFPPSSTEGFDAVIFNFPYGGTFVEKAGPKDIAEHISLLDGIFQSAKPLLAQDGCIWMTLLSSQFQSWRVKDLARRRGFVLVKREPFPWSWLPEYQPVWGDDRDFERTQPRQFYTGRGNFAILCCFATPEAAGRRRQHGSESIRGPTLRATQMVPAADLQVKLGCSRMLRLVDKPTMSRLERDFQGAAAGGGLAARHPLLRAILEAAEDLHLVAHLADILEWQRFVRRHFEYDLSRERSRTLKVRDAFQMLEQKNSEDVLHGRRLFDRFRAAWARGAEDGCMARYGCKELPATPSMSQESPLALSCADEAESPFIVALVQSLVEKQNAFLHQVLEIAAGDLPAAFAVRSVLEYWFHPGGATLPLVSIEDVNETHLLIQSTEENGLAWMTRLGSAGAFAAWELETEGSVRRDPELLVPGTDCVYDWELLEQEAAERLLQKAVQIDFKVVPFPFGGEAFLNEYDFLEEVCLRVAQEVSPEAPRDFLMSSVKAVDLLASLQAAIAVVRRLAPHPQLSMIDLCSRWLNASNLHNLMQQSECHGLKVAHLVHLFEEVELQAAKDVVGQAEALLPCYCEALQGALPCMQTWQGSTAVRAQEIMLRISIRWLSHGQPKPNDLISTYAEKALRQVPREQVDSAQLFDDLKLANICDALQVAQKNCPGEDTRLSSAAGSGGPAMARN